MKKLFYVLGATAAVVTPVVAVVSCGSKESNKTNETKTTSEVATTPEVKNPAVTTPEAKAPEANNQEAKAEVVIPVDTVPADKAELEALLHRKWEQFAVALGYESSAAMPGTVYNDASKINRADAASIDDLRKNGWLTYQTNGQTAQQFYNAIENALVSLKAKDVAQQLDLSKFNPVVTTASSFEGKYAEVLTIIGSSETATEVEMKAKVAAYATDEETKSLINYVIDNYFIAKSKDFNLPDWQKQMFEPRLDSLLAKLKATPAAAEQVVTPSASEAHQDVQTNVETKEVALAHLRSVLGLTEAQLPVAATSWYTAGAAKAGWEHSLLLSIRGTASTVQNSDILNKIYDIFKHFKQTGSASSLTTDEAVVNAINEVISALNDRHIALPSVNPISPVDSIYLA